MTPQFTICGIEELQSFRSTNVTHVLSLVDPDLPDLDEFSSFGKHQRKTLRFHDIIASKPAHVLPDADHMAEILRFGLEVMSKSGISRGSHLLVHCHMGVSRSTAAMLAIWAQAEPATTADSLFMRLAQARPQAWPNSHMIDFADQQLRKDGELRSALRKHYGRQLARRPNLAQLMNTLGREAELQMALVE